jgi:hypothetical protein
MTYLAKSKANQKGSCEAASMAQEEIVSKRE